MDVRVFFYDSGAGLVLSLSISSLSNEILGIALCVKNASGHIRKKNSKGSSLRGKAQWKTREWQLCYPIAQWKEIMATIKEDGELELHTQQRWPRLSCKRHYFY
jgi:hypothetical protein